MKTINTISTILLIVVYSLFSFQINAQTSCSNYALDFNGYNDFVLFQNQFPLNAPGNVTVEFWVYLKDFGYGYGSPNGVFYSRPDSDPFAREKYNFELHGHYLKLYYNGPADFRIYHVLGSTAFIPFNTWTHIGVVRSGNDYSIYTNGILDQTTTDANPDIPSTIGWTMCTNQTSLYIALDEFRTFNFAKTQAQLLSQMNLRLIGNETGLTGLWNFDEGTGKITYDKSGNGNNGILGGSGPDEFVYRPDWVISSAPIDFNDSDNDGINDCLDDCPNNPNKTSPGTCGCGVADDLLWYLDADHDGYAIAIINACESPGIGYTLSVLPLGDCNDDNNTVFPGAYDGNCDKIDNDCDGLIDEDLVLTECQECTEEGLITHELLTWYLDQDQDGFACDCRSGVILSCNNPGEGYTLTVLPTTDCDDIDPLINPNAVDIPCNGVDENCDGHDAICNPCISGDADNDGICDEIDNCPGVYNPLQIDSDCDGVGDECDLCPGGIDTIDRNHDGKPDCAFPPDFSLLPSSWICSNNKVFVCVMEGSGGGKTNCISKNGVKGVVKKGKPNYCGPCFQASCVSNFKTDYNFQNKESWSIYPNPTSGEFNIKLNDPKLSGGEFIIYSLDGKKIMQHKLNGNKFKFNEPKMRPGVYFITLILGNDVETKKLLIN